MAAVTVEFEDGTKRRFPHASRVQDNLETATVSVFTYNPRTKIITVENFPIGIVFGWTKEQ